MQAQTFIRGLDYFFFPFKTAPAAFRNSQTRDGIRAADAGLHHSHSKSPDPAASAIYATAHGKGGILNPVGEARDPTYILMDTKSCS